MSGGEGDDAGLFLNTSLGRLLVIDEERTFDEAVQYCAARGDQLASLRNKTEIYQVANQLDQSNITSTTGDRLKFLKWYVGLKLKNGAGKWIDGTVYNSTRDDTLFGETPNLTGCKVPLMYKYWDLGTANCDTKSRFFCLDSSSSSTINFDTTPETTTFHQSTAATSSQKQYLLIVFGITVLFMLLLLACLVIMRRRTRKKTADSMVSNPVYETSLAVESPPPRLVRVLSNEELDHDYATIHLNQTPRLDRHVYGEITDDRGLESSSEEEEDDPNDVGSAADAKYTSVYLQAF